MHDENVLVGSPEALADVTAAASHGERKLCRTHLMRSCTAGSLVNRNCCDEENYGRSRRYERHLTSVRSDNTSRHTLHAAWMD